MQKNYVPGIPSGIPWDGGVNNNNNNNTIGQTICCGHSDVTNNVNASQTRGLMFAFLANFGHVTGNVFISVPTLGTTRSYTGMDSRTASGLFGNISMVGPAIIINYTLDTQPDFTGTTPVQGIGTGTAEIAITNLTFLPEPTQLALLAGGILCLLALGRAARR